MQVLSTAAMPIWHQLPLITWYVAVVFVMHKSLNWFKTPNVSCVFAYSLESNTSKRDELEYLASLYGAKPLPVKNSRSCFLSVCTMEFYLILIFVVFNTRKGENIGTVSEVYLYSSSLMIPVIRFGPCLQLVVFDVCSTF